MKTSVKGVAEFTAITLLLVQVTEDVAAWKGMEVNDVSCYELILFANILELQNVIGGVIIRNVIFARAVVLWIHPVLGINVQVNLIVHAYSTTEYVMSNVNRKTVYLMGATANRHNSCNSVHLKSIAENHTIMDSAMKDVIAPNALGMDLIVMVV